MPPKVRRLRRSEAITRHLTRGNRFEFLAERLEALDVSEEWAVLERSLSLGTSRGSPEKILVALDEVEKHMRVAGLLYQVALQELAEFRIHYRQVHFQWDSMARKALVSLKRDRETHFTQLTNELVEGWIARNVDEYFEWKAAENKLIRNLNLTDQMFQAWQSRGPSLRKQSDIVEKRRGVDPSKMRR